jgi:hypothetical protein
LTWLAAAENVNAENFKTERLCAPGGPLEFADLIIACGAAMRGVKSVGLKCIVDAACVRVPRLRQRPRHEASVFNTCLGLIETLLVFPPNL